MTRSARRCAARPRTPDASSVGRALPAAIAMLIASSSHAQSPPPGAAPAASPVAGAPWTTGTVAGVPGAPAPRTNGSSIEAVGQAPILGGQGGVGGDRVRARERALDEAFRAAVDQAAETLGPSPMPPERISLLQLRVHANVKGYIMGYRILEESEQGSTFRVRVAADVALTRLDRDLAPRTLAGKPGTDGKPGTPANAPKTLVCLAGRRAGGVSSSMDAGWTVLGDGRLASAAGVASAEAFAMPGGCLPAEPSSEPTDDRAVQAMRATGASLALIGTLQTRPLGIIRGTALRTSHATLALHLLDADGHVVAVGAADRDAWAETEALAEDGAVKAALEAGSVEIAAALAGRRSAALAGAFVDVHLVGCTTLADLQLFERVAGGVPGVASVEPRRITKDGVDLYIYTELESQAIVAAMSRTPDAPRLMLAAETTHRLSARILPPPAPPSAADPSVASPLRPAPGAGESAPRPAQAVAPSPTGGPR